MSKNSKNMWGIIIGKYEAANPQRILIVVRKMAIIFSSMQSASFSFFAMQPEVFSNDFSKFFNRIPRQEFRRMICDALVSALESFLKEALEELALRHSLSTGAFDFIIIIHCQSGEWNVREGGRGTPCN